MRMIWSFVRLDIAAHYHMLWKAGAIGLAVVLLLLVTGGPSLAVIAAANLMPILMLRFFDVDQSAHLDALYCALPISRRQVVSGRYLTLLLGSAITTAVGTVLTAALYAGAPIVSPARGAVLALATATILDAGALPFGFALGSQRAWAPILASFAAVSAALLLASRVFPDLGHSVSAMPDRVFWILSLVAAVALAVSWAASAHLYARRAL